MSYKLIIAEKPSVAASIAKVVGAGTAHRDKAVGYLEGNGYHVTWAFGHLVTLKRPEEIGFTGTQLPIFPEKWETKYVESKDASYNAMVKKQMEVIRTQFTGCDEIIVATDAGREGELIFRYIYEHIGCNKPFRRLWISSLTDQAIREGMAALIPGSQMEALSSAAHARSETDYLVGFNASRALRLATAFKGNLSLGRVQTPVLVMVCDRFAANKNFVPTPFWQIQATLTKGGTGFKVLTKRHYDKEEDAKADGRTVCAQGEMRVISVEKKEVVTKPPLLYDLTSLQRAANTKYGMTADRTLKTAQSLYEKKFLSYPRTGSRYIPEDVFKTIPGLIGKIGTYGGFGPYAQSLTGRKLCRKSVDNAKITDHHALLPTDNIPSGLEGDEKKIWEMVAGRTLEAFGEDSRADRTTAEFDAAGVRFTATGSVVTYPGWKAVFGDTAPAETKEDKGDGKDGKEEEENVSMPELREGEHLPSKDVSVVRKTDKPLPVYTDASLLGEMETCGKKIEDEELREAMKDVGLGTPATRAAVIETLIARGYIERQGKKLIPTGLGDAVADFVRGRKIADVQTTGIMERDLSEIEQGKTGRGPFDAKTRDYVLEIIEDIRKNCKPIDGASLSSEPVRTCPLCGKPMKNMKFSVNCDAEAGGCGFKINREVAGKKLPSSAIDALAAGKETAMLKGFRKKDGKTFDCRLGIDRERKQLKFVFHETPAVQNATCPCCGKAMTDDKWKLSCGCGLMIYKTQGGVGLNETTISALLQRKKVLVKGMTSKDGKKYDAYLYVDTQERKIARSFPPKK